jgi:pimeloyl-ACP methyl ester carboxylesterase
MAYSCVKPPSTNNSVSVMKIVATDATMVVRKDCGHWVLEEKPKETTDALLKFL